MTGTHLLLMTYLTVESVAQWKSDAARNQKVEGTQMFLTIFLSYTLDIMKKKPFFSNTHSC